MISSATALSNSLNHHGVLGSLLSGKEQETAKTQKPLPPLPLGSLAPTPTLPPLPEASLAPKLPALAENQRTNNQIQSSGQINKSSYPHLASKPIDQVENILIAIALILKSYSPEDIESLICMTGDPLEAAFIKRMYHFCHLASRK